MSDAIVVHLGDLISFEGHEYVIGAMDRAVRVEGNSMTLHAYDPTLWLVLQRETENRKKILEQTPRLQQRVEKEMLDSQ